MRHQGLDHLAIAMPDTEAALKLWRDTFGFKVLCGEDANGGTGRLTHLYLGNTQLQLVQPLTPDHPLPAWLAKTGPGLHRFCLPGGGYRQGAEPFPCADRAERASGHAGRAGGIDGQMT